MFKYAHRVSKPYTHSNLGIDWIFTFLHVFLYRKVYYESAYIIILHLIKQIEIGENVKFYFLTISYYYI